MFLMILNIALIILVLTRLVVLKDRTQYFRSRQHVYLLALRDLLISSSSSSNALTASSRPSTSGSAKVHPLSGEGNAYHYYSSDGEDDVSPAKSHFERESGTNSSSNNDNNPHRSDSENSTEGLLRRSRTQAVAAEQSNGNGKENNGRGSKKKKKKPPRTPSMVRLSALHNGGIGTAGDILLSGKSWRELDDDNKAPSVLDTAFQYPARLLQVNKNIVCFCVC
jgi:hypothetical protein